MKYDKKEVEQMCLGCSSKLKLSKYNICGCLPVVTYRDVEYKCPCINCIVKSTCNSSCDALTEFYHYNNLEMSLQMEKKLNHDLTRVELEYKEAEYKLKTLLAINEIDEARLLDMRRIELEKAIFKANSEVSTHSILPSPNFKEEI